MHFLPESRNTGHLKHGLHMQPLGQAHGFANFFHSRVDPRFLKGLAEGLHWGEAAVIHYGTRPVKNDRFNSNTHACSSCSFIYSLKIFKSLSMSSG